MPPRCGIGCVMPFHLAGAASPLAVLAAWCGAPPHAVPSVLFLTGLIGGFAHCGPMCGPFVLAQAATSASDIPVFGRLAGGLLLPYHLGRVATYAGLGAFAAALGAAAAAIAPLRLAAAALLITAALLFALQALARLAPELTHACGGRWREALSLRWAERLARLSGPLFDMPTPAGRFTLGMVLGLLPCGFLYAALAAAASTRDPLAGAAAMMAFCLGTAPSLMLVGVGGAACATRWRRLARLLLAPLFLVNAAVLSLAALSLASLA